MSCIGYIRWSHDLAWDTGAFPRLKMMDVLHDFSNDAETVPRTLTSCERPSTARSIPLRLLVGSIWLAFHQSICEDKQGSVGKESVGLLVALLVSLWICPVLTCHQPDHMPDSLARMTPRRCLVAPSSPVHHLHKKSAMLIGLLGKRTNQSTNQPSIYPSNQPSKNQHYKQQ
jgi:hypothetical protein